MAWDILTLGEVLSIKHGWAFKGEHFVQNGEYIVLTPGNIHESGGLKLKGEKEIFYDGDFPEEYILSKGDMLVVMTDLKQTAPILGGALIIPEDNRFLHNQRLGLVDIKNRSKIDYKFIYYIFNSEFFRSLVRTTATGATVRHTAPSRIYDCKVPCPKDIHEQKRVASVLSTYDDLIANNNRRMELLEESMRLLYREWFVHLRFPGYERAKIVDSLPNGWEKKFLSQIAVVNNQTLTKSTAPKLINYIDISSVSPGHINQVTLINFSNAPSRARRIVKHGDIIWSSVRPNRRSYSLILHPEENTIVSTGFAVITSIDVPYTFLYFAVTTDDFAKRLSNIATGAAYPAVKTKDFEDAIITIPSKSLLIDFNKFAGPIVLQIHTLRQHNQSLRKARDMLLPRLMNGSIPV